MKVTKREKILLIILAVLLVGFVYYKLIIKKQNENIKNLTSKKNEYEQKVESVKNKIASKNRKSLEIKILNSKILDKYDRFFPKLEQERIIVILNEMLENSKLEGNVLSFSENVLEKANIKTKSKKSRETHMGKLVEEYNSLENKTKNNNENIGSNKNTIKNNSKDSSINSAVSKMQCTLSFKGTYEEIFDFINKIENFNKEIIINNISIASSEENFLSGSILLDFYSIPKFKNEDYYKYDFASPKGKYNPFKISMSNNKSKVDDSASKTEKNKIEYDFLMNVKPLSSDLPTIMIGKAKDIERNTYIFSDKNDIENVAMYFIRKNNKYFYKYKTSKQKYPMNFKEVEFKPNGEKINVKIYSTSRNSEIDKAGVNLKIYNKTDLDTDVYIKGDDKNRPRVNVIKEGVVNIKEN
ncbi:hypothetical protein ACFIJ5_05780 [Haloimpatiens sp. FM7330]|uniref:hypothetical protein n=1 Tax=Haloimpatiens sp. FM7330 TaxID=3298610 RepID=UPI00362EED42